MKKLVGALALLLSLAITATATAQHQPVPLQDTATMAVGKTKAEGSLLTGRVHYLLRGADGTVKLDREIGNLVVDAGKAGVASRINGAGGEAAFTYVGIGIGVTAAAAGDTALQTERDETGAANTNHKSGTASRVTTDVTNDTAQLVATFNFTASLAVTEAGMFNASPNGVMLARQVFSAINVVNGDSLQVTWKIDVDRGGGSPMAEFQGGAPVATNGTTPVDAVTCGAAEQKKVFSAVFINKDSAEHTIMLRKDISGTQWERKVGPVQPGGRAQLLGDGPTVLSASTHKLVIEMSEAMVTTQPVVDFGVLKTP